MPPTDAALLPSRSVAAGGCDRTGRRELVRRWRLAGLRQCRRGSVPRARSDRLRWPDYAAPEPTTRAQRRSRPARSPDRCAREGHASRPGSALAAESTRSEASEANLHRLKERRVGECALSLRACRGLSPRRRNGGWDLSERTAKSAQCFVRRRVGDLRVGGDLTVFSAANGPGKKRGEGSSACRLRGSWGEQKRRSDAVDGRGEDTDISRACSRSSNAG